MIIPFSSRQSSFIMVPTGTGKTRRHFAVGEKSGNFDKTGKVREFYSKYWKK